MRNTVITILKGFCMGAADIIPGVSGGTVALMMGFYARLINAIRAFDGALLLYLYRGKFRVAVQHTDLAFLFALCAGIMAALVFFTRVIPLPVLIRAYPEMVYGLFFGLIAASIGVLLRGLGRIGWRDTGWLMLGILTGYWLVGVVPMDTPEAPWFIFLSGSLAICAMILPGISGAFVLVILKKYAYLLAAIGQLDFGVLAPFGLGCIVGLLLFSRSLAWLLRRFRRQTFSVLTGILAGTLWVIWPFQEHTWESIGGELRLTGSLPAWPGVMDGVTLAAFGLMAAGVAAVLVIDTLAARSVRDIPRKNLRIGK
nr:MAG: putative membrane protein [Candidatus Kentron sp. DK]